MLIKMDWIWLFFFGLLYTKFINSFARSSCLMPFHMLDGYCPCPYRFEKTHDVIEVDGSITVGTVVYTVSIQYMYPTTTSAVTSISSGVSVTPIPPEPRITLVTPSPFELHPLNNRQVLVRECIWSRDLQQYELRFFMRSYQYPQCGYMYTRHSLESLELIIWISSAFPIYTIVEQSYVFELADDQNASFVELFKTEISNEQYFGGCGSFECQARCLNDGQTFFVDDDNFNVMANRSSLVEGFTYTINITCYDSRNSSDRVFYDNQTFTVNVTFSRYAGAVTEGPITINVSEALMTTAILSSITTERNGSQTTLAITTAPTSSKIINSDLATNTTNPQATTTPKTGTITASSAQVTITQIAAAITTSSVFDTTTPKAITTSSFRATTNPTVGTIVTSSALAKTNPKGGVTTTSSSRTTTAPTAEAITTSSVFAVTTSTAEVILPTTISSVRSTLTPTEGAKITSSVLATTTPTEGLITTSSVLATANPTAEAKTTSSVLAATTSTVRAIATSSVRATTTPTVRSITTSSNLATTTPTVEAIATSSILATKTPTVGAVANSSVLAITTSTVGAIAKSSVRATTTPTVGPITTSLVLATPTSTTEAISTSSVLATTTPTTEAITISSFLDTTTPTEGAIATPSTRVTTITEVPVTTTHTALIVQSLSTFTGSTTSDRYSQYTFFDDVRNLVAVTTSGIVVIAITASISAIGYKIHRRRMQGSRVIPL